MRLRLLRPWHILRSWRAAFAFVAACVCFVVAPRGAAAKPFSLKPAWAEKGEISLDGVPGEWFGGKRRLTETVQGKDGKPDLAAEVALAYDDDYLYVGADVTDDAFKPGGDRVSVIIGFSGGATHTVHLIPGNPGKSAGRAVNGNGSNISGAKVIEAPHEEGYTLEARIPWSAFPPARTIRIGLRGAVQVSDADSGQTIESIISNAKGTSFKSLPPLNMVPEQSLGGGLLRKKSVPNKPSCNKIANVAGDKLQERILVFGTYLVVLGPNFRGGKQYYWNDMSVPDYGLAVVGCETRDMDGDGRDEVILRKRYGKGKRWREIRQILSFGGEETPTTIFAHETALQSEHGAIKNQISFKQAGGKVNIEITPGQARGYDSSNYAEATETSVDPLLLPWGSVALQRYEFSGGRYAMAYEKTQTPKETTSPKPAFKPSKPSKPKKPQLSGQALSNALYESYKQAQNKSGSADYTGEADIAGGSDVERVIRHGRDIVFFGPGIRGGEGYAFSTLQMFKSEKDIGSIKLKDVTGDGKAEIIVRGKVFANAPKEAGGGEVERRVLIVYQVDNDRLERVLAVEIYRSVGSDSVSSKYWLKKGKVVLKGGNAKGWTKSTYPFSPDEGSIGGFMPLVLPWGEDRTYTFDGSAFK